MISMDADYLAEATRSSIFILPHPGLQLAGAMWYNNRSRTRAFYFLSIVIDCYDQEW